MSGEKNNKEIIDPKSDRQQWLRLNGTALAAAVVLAPLAYPGYDWMAQAVSDLSGGLCVWGGINLLEGYGQDNPAANAHVR